MHKNHKNSRESLIIPPGLRKISLESTEMINCGSVYHQSIILIEVNISSD